MGQNDTLGTVSGYITAQVDGPADRTDRRPALVILWEEIPGSGLFVDHVTGQTYRKAETAALAGHVLLLTCAARGR